eukprot:jgi/Hompol1/2671/HPOL_006134-RA
MSKTEKARFVIDRIIQHKLEARRRQLNAGVLDYEGASRVKHVSVAASPLAQNTIAGISASQSAETPKLVRHADMGWATDIHAIPPETAKPIDPNGRVATLDPLAALSEAQRQLQAASQHTGGMSMGVAPIPELFDNPIDFHVPPVTPAIDSIQHVMQIVKGRVHVAPMDQSSAIAADKTVDEKMLRLLRRLHISVPGNEAYAPIKGAEDSHTDILTSDGHAAFSTDLNANEMQFHNRINDFDSEQMRSEQGDYIIRNVVREGDEIDFIKMDIPTLDGMPRSTPMDMRITTTAEQDYNAGQIADDHEFELVEEEGRLDTPLFLEGIPAKRTTLRSAAVYTMRTGTTTAFDTRAPTRLRREPVRIDCHLDPERLRKEARKRPFNLSEMRFIERNIGLGINKLIKQSLSNMVKEIKHTQYMHSINRVTRTRVDD